MSLLQRQCIQTSNNVSVWMSYYNSLETMDKIIYPCSYPTKDMLVNGVHGGFSIKLGQWNDNRVFTLLTLFKSICNRLPGYNCNCVTIVYLRSGRVYTRDLCCSFFFIKNVKPGETLMFFYNCSVTKLNVSAACMSNRPSLFDEIWSKRFIQYSEPQTYVLFLDIMWNHNNESR